MLNSSRPSRIRSAIALCHVFSRAFEINRWDYLPEEKADDAEIGEQIFMKDLARELARELGAEPPQELWRVEKLKFDELDPERPQAYLREQIDKFGV